MGRRICHAERPGSARNFDEFRNVPTSAKTRCNRRGYANYVRTVFVEKSAANGAIEAIDSIRKFSSDEKGIAKEVVRYVKANPTAAYDDICICGAGKYRGKQFSFFDVRGNLLVRAVAPGSVKRIVEVLLLKGILIDPQRLKRLREAIRNNKKKQDKNY